MGLFSRGKKKGKKKRKDEEVIKSGATGKKMVISEETAKSLRRNPIFKGGGGRLKRHGRGFVVITPKFKGFPR